MTARFQGLPVGAALLTLGISISTAGYLVTSAQVSAQDAAQQKAAQQGVFPDVQPDYWAQPFIQALAKEGIITGYLDGTYRPENPLDRDEFAAIIRQAFSQEQVRTIPSGSVFKDVPSNYWAAPPIEEAYETGFMKGYPKNLFRPQEEVTKVQALAALARGLEWAYKPPVPTAQATTTTVTPEPARKRRTPNRLAFPLATTALMQPILQLPSKAQNPPAPATGTSATTATGQNAPTGPSALEYLKSHYVDAEQIPEYAVNDVAAATRANIVVNYPKVRVLEPNGLITRGAAAALIYQTLVHQGKVQPLPNNLEASNYIVNPTSGSNQTAQSAQ
ncbi:MAG TPA: S-layer homology domain-containing protein [Coleofasciculaceae cyanobacterium]